MKKQSEREELLSEELLHTITGGCHQCQSDNAYITRLANQADLYSRLALTASDMGDHELAIQHSATARSYAQDALFIQQRIRERSAQPGHSA